MTRPVELRDFMSELSERAYCAGWHDSTEAILWEIMKKGKPVMWCCTKITREDIRKLRKLYKELGGWWIFAGNENESVYSPAFLLLKDWLEYYNKTYVHGLGWQEYWKKKYKKVK